MAHAPQRSKSRGTVVRAVIVLLTVLFGLSLRSAPAPVHADSAAPPALSIGPVSAQFYQIATTAAAFDPSRVSGTSLHSGTFPVIDFNPNTSSSTDPGLGIKLSCSNLSTVTGNTSTFTDVLPNADGTCTTFPAGTVGNGGGASFEAVFTANLYVPSAGQVTFNVNADDGLYLGFGPNINNAAETVARVSGTDANVPSTTAVQNYPVVGGNNNIEAPTTNAVTFSFPDQGVYPMEVDYFEVRGGQEALVLSYGTGSASSAIPIPAQPEVSRLSPLSLDQDQAGQSVTISGSNFLPDSQVQITDESGNASTVTPSSVSTDGTSLSFTMPSGLAIGTYTMAVQNPTRNASPVLSGALTFFMEAAGSPPIDSSTSGTSFDPSGSVSVNLPSDPQDPTNLATHATLTGLGTLSLAKSSHNLAPKLLGNRKGPKGKTTVTTGTFGDLHLSPSACSAANLQLEQSKGVTKLLTIKQAIVKATAGLKNKKLLMAYDATTAAWKKLPRQTIDNSNPSAPVLESTLSQSDPKARLKPCDLNGDPTAVTDDVTAPAITVLAAYGSPQTPYDDTSSSAPFVNQPVTFTVNANDMEDDSTDGSGVASIFYQLDNGPAVQIYDGTADDFPETAQGTFTVSGDGAHTITVWSVDQLGNGAPGDIVTNDDGTTSTTYDPTTVYANVDQAGPSITDGGPTTQPNSNGWYRTPVTEAFEASSVGDLAAPCQAASGSSCTFTMSTGAAQEGQDLSIASGQVKDNAGDVNHGIMVGDYNVDMTPPVTTAAVPPTTTAWYTTAVPVTLNAGDNLSGVDATYYTIDGGSQQTYSGMPFAVSGDGTHTVTFWSVDKAGNVEDKTAPANTITLKIDSTAPTTTAAVPSANANGWYNQAVPVTLNPSDTLSGVASTYDTIDGGSQETYSGSFLVSGDGTHTITYWSVDNAGNSESANTLTLKIDTTPPTVTGKADRVPDFNGWYNHPVTISWSGDDHGGSGVGPCDQPTTYSGPDSASASVSGSCSDLTGNVGIGSYPFQYDGTAPSIAGQLSPANPAITGWYNQSTGAPTASFLCTFSISGLAPGSSCPSAYTFPAGSGLSYTSPTVTGGSGLTSTSVTFSGINVDLTAPTCTVTMSPSSIWPPNKKMVPVTATVTVSDGGSGPNGFVLQSITSNEGSITSESSGWQVGQASTSGFLQADRNGTGSGRVYTFTYLASDKAGNTSTCMGTVTVPHEQGH